MSGKQHGTSKNLTELAQDQCGTMVEPHNVPQNQYRTSQILVEPLQNHKKTCRNIAEPQKPLHNHHRTSKTLIEPARDHHRTFIEPEQAS